MFAPDRSFSPDARHVCRQAREAAGKLRLTAARVDAFADALCCRQWDRATEAIDGAIELLERAVRATEALGATAEFDPRSAA